MYITLSAGIGALNRGQSTCSEVKLNRKGKNDRRKGTPDGKGLEGLFNDEEDHSGTHADPDLSVADRLCIAR